MPTYEYKCFDCGNLYEIFQKMTDDNLKTCPECNGHVKRLIGAGLAPMFKGSGFYQTDYKTNSSKTIKNENPTASTTTEPKKSDTKQKSPETGA